jgi:hypothetical protein
MINKILIVPLLVIIFFRGNHEALGQVSNLIIPVTYFVNHIQN